MVGAAHALYALLAGCVHRAARWAGRVWLAAQMAELRARETQLQLRIAHLLRDPAPDAGLQLAMLMAQCAALRCQRAHLELLHARRQH